MAVSTADAAGVFVVIAFAAVFIVATVLVARRLSVEDSMIVYCFFVQRRCPREGVNIYNNWYCFTEPNLNLCSSLLR